MTILLILFLTIISFYQNIDVDVNNEDIKNLEEIVIHLQKFLMFFLKQKAIHLEFQEKVRKRRKYPNYSSGFV